MRTGALTGRIGRCLLSVAALGLVTIGCGREGPEPGRGWWDQVTGVPGDSLGFQDFWRSATPGGEGANFTASIRSANLARLDFSAGGGGYSVVFNHGRTVQVNPPPAEEVALDRTLFLTYLLPFLGRAGLTAALASLRIDTLAVESGVIWNGRACLRVGGAAKGGEPTAGVDNPDDAVPAIYFDQETGAVLRLIRVSSSPFGRRVSEFRLFDHEQRAGAWLPTRFETWGPQGLRSSLRRVSREDGKGHPIGLYEIPAQPPGAS